MRVEEARVNLRDLVGQSRFTLKVSKKGLRASHGMMEDVEEPYQATWASGASAPPSSLLDTVILNT